jgi:hypothetical protein
VNAARVSLDGAPLRRGENEARPPGPASFENRHWSSRTQEDQARSTPLADEDEEGEYHEEKNRHRRKAFCRRRREGSPVQSEAIPNLGRPG